MYVASLWSRSFFLRESPRTNPLERASLHRRNMNAERPWGILSLFTTCFRQRVNSSCQRLWHRHVPGIFVEQGLRIKWWFLRWIIADYMKGSSPLKHNCEETGVGWGTLEPLEDPLPITKSRNTNMWFTSVDFHVAKGKNTSVWQNN